MFEAFARLYLGRHEVFAQGEFMAMGSGTRRPMAIGILAATFLAVLTLSNGGTKASTAMALHVDINISQNQPSAASSFTSPAFNVPSRELLLATVSSDGPPGGSQSITSVSGAG